MNQGILKFIGGSFKMVCGVTMGIKNCLMKWSINTKILLLNINCTLEVVSSLVLIQEYYLRVGNTGLDFDSSSPNNGVANYINRQRYNILYRFIWIHLEYPQTLKIGGKRALNYQPSDGIRTNYYPLGVVSISMDAISKIVTNNLLVILHKNNYRTMEVMEIMMLIIILMYQVHPLDKS